MEAVAARAGYGAVVGFAVGSCPVVVDSSHLALYLCPSLAAPMDQMDAAIAGTIRVEGAVARIVMAAPVLPGCHSRYMAAVRDFAHASSAGTEQVVLVKNNINNYGYDMLIHHICFIPWRSPACICGR